MRPFVVLGLVFSIPSQETGLGKLLRNDLFCVKWDVKPQLNQSITQSINQSTTKVSLSVEASGLPRLMHASTDQLHSTTKTAPYPVQPFSDVSRNRHTHRSRYIGNSGPHLIILRQSAPAQSRSNYCIC